MFRSFLLDKTKVETPKRRPANQQQQEKVGMEVLQKLADGITMKQFSNKMSQFCYDKCLKFDDQQLQYDEQKCLENCVKKLKQSISTNVKLVKDEKPFDVLDIRKLIQGQFHIK